MRKKANSNRPGGIITDAVRRWWHSLGTPDQWADDVGCEMHSSAGQSRRLLVSAYLLGVTNSQGRRMMCDELTLEEQKAIDELSNAIAGELAKGEGKENIVKELVKQNWAEEPADQFVTIIEQTISDYRNSPEVRKVLAGKYARHMICGFFWAVGGIVVTVLTINAASAGGTYVVAWGAILFGVIDFLRGLFGWIRYSL